MCRKDGNLGITFDVIDDATRPTNNALVVVFQVIFTSSEGEIDCSRFCFNGLICLISPIPKDQVN